MKNLKKLASVFLALAMIMALCVPAFAAPEAVDGPYTITITNDREGHIYEAYQIFQGDIAKDENGQLVLSNIEWGNNISEDGKAALIEFVGLEEGATAADVAAKLTAEHDTEQAQALAKIAGEKANLTDTPTPHIESVWSATDKNYTITVSAGYYLIMDQADSLTDKKDEAYTRYILQVVTNQKMNPKSEVPEIDKKIVEGNDRVNGTTSNVGDKVTFEVTSTVPDTTGYETYQYVVSDTMSDGLTFNNDIVVTVEGENTPAYTVNTEVEGKTFEITFNNLVDYAGKTVVITYSATVNEGALKTDVEKNTVGLQYSNNPNKDDELGKTPDKTVYVYDFDIEIDKYTTINDENVKLANAKFVLRQKDTSNYYFWNESEEKVEWTAISDDDEDTWKETEWTNAGASVVTTDGDGKASFKGLAAGKYELIEIEAPAGYNLLLTPEDVEITIELDADGKLSSSAAVGDNGQYSQVSSVENNSGSLLPSTGGIGTTIFYTVGGILVVGAAILLVARKRVSDEQ